VAVITMHPLLLPLSIIAVVVALFVIMAVILIPQKTPDRTAALREMIDQYRVNDTSVSESPDSVVTRLRASSSNRTANLLEKRGWNERLRAGLTSAGMSVKPEEFVLLTIGSGLGGAIVLFLLLRASLPGAMLGLVIGTAIPILVMRVKASKREAQFVYDLPDALGAIASSLSSGASLAQAFDAVASESSGAMQEELQRVIIQNRLGTSVPDALQETAARMHCVDLEMVVMAIRLQSSVGGNLATLLKTVATTLRERVKMARHVRALSAEGRMSLWVLMALPVVVGIFSALTRPEYFQIFLTTVPGMMMLGIGSIMMLLGYLWARSIVNVEL